MKFALVGMTLFAVSSVGHARDCELPNGAKFTTPLQCEQVAPNAVEVPANKAAPAASTRAAPPASSGSRYIRGPKGGCYYINRNGNKSYVDRSLC